MTADAPVVTKEELPGPGPIETDFFWSRIPIQTFDYGDVLVLWMPKMPRAREVAARKDLQEHLAKLHREDICVFIVESDVPTMIARLSDRELAKLGLQRIPKETP